jgi:hypothetical protein
MPCDTVVSFTLEGVATDVDLSATDSLTFTEIIIGRLQVLRAEYKNTGTTTVRVASVSLPALPFRTVRTQPSLPAVLLPGEALIVDMELRQRVGTYIDSLVVVVDSPCVRTATTILNSTATTLTHLVMPTLRGAVDVVTMMPVLLRTRPAIDSTVATDYSLQVRCSANECLVIDGSDSLSSWSVARQADELVISISGQWNRSDTLVRIPMTPLLSRVDSVAVLFERSPGLMWKDFESPVTYDDGSIIIEDVCATRRKRMVSFDARPLVAIRPQPARDHFVIVLSDDAEHMVQITATDILGRTRSFGQTMLTKSGSFSTDSMSDGVYTLTISVDGIATQHTMIVMRNQ